MPAMVVINLQASTAMFAIPVVSRSQGSWILDEQQHEHRSDDVIAEIGYVGRLDTQDW